MKRQTSILFFSIALLLSLNLMIASPTSACTHPAPDPNATPPPPVYNAPYIFVGTVIDGERMDNIPSWREVVIKVEMYLNGSGYDEVTIAGFSYNFCSHFNQVELELGERYIFFAAGEQGQILSPVYGHARDVYGHTSDAMLHASDEKITEIIASTGQSTEPIPLPLHLKLKSEVQDFNVSTLILQVILAMVMPLVAVGLVYKMKTSQRKAKVKNKLRH